MFITDEEFILLVDESMSRAARVDLEQRLNEGEPVYRWGTFCSPGNWYKGLFQLKDDESAQFYHGTCDHAFNADAEWFVKEILGG